MTYAIHGRNKRMPVSDTRTVDLLHSVLDLLEDVDARLTRMETRLVKLMIHEEMTQDQIGAARLESD